MCISRTGTVISSLNTLGAIMYVLEAPARMKYSLTMLIIMNAFIRLKTKDTSMLVAQKAAKYAKLH